MKEKSGIKKRIKKNLDMTQTKLKVEFLKVFDQFPNPIWRGGTDAKCNFFNRGWLEFTGRTFEEEVGDGWTQGVHPDDIEGCFKTYMEAFKDQKPFEMEYRLLHHSGEYRYILDCGRPIFEEDGTFAGYIGSCYDIHDTKTLKEELNALTQEYETIFNGTQDSMFLIDVDYKGNAVYRRNNKAHEALVGFTSERIKGHTPREVLGDEIGSQLEAYYNKCIIEKSTISYEQTLDLGTGDKVWHTVLSPIIKEGLVAQIVGSRRDITKMKEMEEGLIESEERYRSFFENNHAVMLLVDPQTGNLAAANHAASKFYGYPIQRLTQMKISEINISTSEQIQKEMETAKNEKRNHFFFQHRLASGEIRDVEVYSGPMTNSGKQFLYSIIHDITSRRKTENELFNEKELFKITIHSMGDGLLTTDTEGRITLLNKVAEEITEWTFKEAGGKPSSEVFNIINGSTGVRCEDPVKRVLETGNIITLEENTVLISKNNIKKNIADSGAPIRDNSGNISGAVIVFRNISDEKQRREEIEYLGLHDTLTGLYNRTFLEKELERLELDETTPVSLIMGDVNGLKLTNDAFGHEAGDKLLKKIAYILKDECRKGDIIARIGGDEFVIVLPKTGIDETEKIIERIISKCAHEKEDPIKPSISLGFSVKEYKNQHINNVYKTAEDRMYSTKLMEGKSIRSSIISSLRKTLSERTHETEEHSARLIELSYKFGKMLGLSIDMIHNLQLLAMIHDIGISAIPDYILNKKGDLTPEDWEIMEKHCEIGYRIACASPDLAHIANGILHHHENWDGSGYPRGLAEKDIPLSSRVISVLDCYDSLVYGSFYQKPMSKHEAIEFIKNQSGIRFDPEMVEVFNKIIN